MPRFSRDRLLAKALYALDRAFEQCRERPVEPSPALRFTLAWLANDVEPRWPFDQFWADATMPLRDGEDPRAAAIGRRQAVNGDLNAIYRALGIERP